MVYVVYYEISVYTVLIFLQTDLAEPRVYSLLDKSTKFCNILRQQEFKQISNLQ